MKSLEHYLEELPSRIYHPEKAHDTHQLVIEKFPNLTWSVTYVCIGCKGKTIQFIHEDLNVAVMQAHKWVIDSIERNNFKLIPWEK